MGTTDDCGCAPWDLQTPTLPGGTGGRGIGVLCSQVREHESSPRGGTSCSVWPGQASAEQAGERGPEQEAVGENERIKGLSQVPQVKGRGTGVMSKNNRQF